MGFQQITPRDSAVVLDVYKYKYLTSSQIQTLHFPSETTRNRRIRRLVEHGYLKPFTVANIPERLFKVTKAGAELVASAYDVEVRELLWKPGTKTPSDHFFMRHFVRLNDFRIALTQASGAVGVSLRGFIPEYYGNKHLSGRVTKYLKDVAFDISDPRHEIPHTPDAVFCLEKGGKTALFFLEIDRGTETLSNPGKGFLKMIRFYLGYMKSRGFKGYAQDFNTDEFAIFRTLIVTTSATRVKHMKKACLALPEGVHNDLRFLWCSLFEYVRPEYMYKSIWTSLLLSDNQMYQIA